MIRDITIGQYFPGESIIHRLDPRFKIIITIIYIVMLFTGSSALCLGVGALYTFIAIALSHIPLKMFWKSVRPLLPFLLITAVITLQKEANLTNTMCLMLYFNMAAQVQEFMMHDVRISL